MAKKNNQQAAPRPEKNPGEWKALAYKIWIVIFTSGKVIVGAVATVLLICIVCGFALMSTLSEYLENDILPNASLVLENYEMDAPSTVYCVNDNGQIQVLQELYASTDWKKADYEDIPEALINAAIAIEDKRFYEHQGVDWFTTIKAFANMFFGEATVGGSSITQQLIKNITEDDSVTVQRKVQEFFRATLVEKNNDKKAIIEEYLNTIYLGQGSRGVKSAAEAYFGKELQTLTIAECASLISITNNPSMFNPYSEKVFTYQGQEMNGMQRNQHRQRLVLGEMYTQGYITREEYDEAMAQELVLKNKIDKDDRWIVCSNEKCDYEGVRKSYSEDSKKIKCPVCGTVPEEREDSSQEVYSYFVDVVVQDVAKAMAKKDGIEKWNDSVFEEYLERISTGGYAIYATIDLSVQNQIDKIYKDLKKIPSVKSAQQLQSAIVIIDNTTGDIVGMAGGVGEEKAHFGQNRATKSKLQSGSSIKPLSIYAPGFESGALTPATVITDLPVKYDKGSPWPKNDNRKYLVSRTVFSGIEDSVNAVAANSAKKIGLDYGYEFAKDSFGISTLVEDDIQLGSLALGAQYYGVTVRDMTAAYATFANQGVYRTARTWTKVYDRKGNIVLTNEQQSRGILSKKAVNYTNYCLTNAVAKGTGTRANFASGYIAGKTGTTSSARDKWFCGYTKHYTAAVWCGFDWPEKINLSYNPAAQLWKDVMKPIHSGLSNVRLYDAGKMTSVTVCLDSGLLATDACLADARGSRAETVNVYPEDRPKGSCTHHVAKKFCSVSNCVANEYCLKFAAVDSSVVITEKAVVKMTQSKVTEMLKAKDNGLDAKFLVDNYVYLTNDEGADAAFKGFDGKGNVGVSAPYRVCTAHNAANWGNLDTDNAG